ncbi:MAG TPA: hypothetical protein VL994_11225 [Steroidobacteraceae bacterium]|nr:hypothetical protein [Steroidobacteraceae bacterium]
MSNALNLILLLIFSMTLALGQLLFKRVGNSIRGAELLGAARIALHDPALYGALLLYGGATILWIWLLGRVSLMQAYPWVGVGVILVPLLSARFFGERAGPLFWLGALLVAVGIVLTQYGTRPD